MEEPVPSMHDPLWQARRPDLAKGKHRHPDTGLIYFVEAVGLDRIKIGYTSGTFQARLAVIQTGSPVEIKPLLVWKDRTKRDEADIHRMFPYQRTHGEWYVLDSIIAAYIRDVRKVHTAELVVWDKNIDWLIRRKEADIKDIVFIAGEVESRIGYHPDMQ